MKTTIDWPRRLKALRKAAGLTQPQMAERLGYSHASHVAALESGKLTITPMLERLIEALEDRDHAATLSRRAPQSRS